MIAAACFWVAVLLIAYAYLGYPLWIRARPARPYSVAVRDAPSVSILVVAHNEERRLAARIENLLGLDYPRDRMEIVIGSDGSTDGTVACALAFSKERVRVVAFAAHRGKAAVLNDLIPRCRGAIVVMADARQRFEPGALKALVRPFADRSVGAVSGELILTHPGRATAVGEGIGLYWRYEKWIRTNESRFDSTVGATGAIYAIRRPLFRPIPKDTILDDVLIPLRIARRGLRVVFEPGARACDRPPETAREEFTRKVRTIAGNFQLFARERWLLDPARNRLWLQTVSHKGLRLLGPLLFGAALASNALLADRPFYRVTLIAQILFYASACAGRIGVAGRRIPFLSLPYVVCLLNLATAVAFLRFATGRQRVTWERAAP